MATAHHKQSNHCKGFRCACKGVPACSKLSEHKCAFMFKFDLDAT